MMQLSAVDEVLPFSRLLFLGLQHVLVMYAGDVAVELRIPGQGERSSGIKPNTIPG
jgi:xanthine/uracil permease